MKIALFGDLHLGIKNGNHTFHEYLTTKTERSIIEIAGQGITDIFFFGDFFDNRRAMPVNIIHWCMNEFPAILKKHGLTAHILCGNHDTYYLNTNKYSSLDVFNGLENIKTYKDYSVLSDFGIVIVPWINKENVNDILQNLKTEDKNYYVFGHFELNGFKMYENSIKFDGGLDLRALKEFRHTYTGHFHHPSSQRNITYLGSSATLTRSDIYDIDKKGWYCLDLSTNECVLNSDKESIFVEYVYNDNLNVNSLDINNKHVDFVINDEINNHQFQSFKNELRQYKMLSMKVIDNRELENEITDETDSKLSNSKISSTRQYLELRIEDSQLDNKVKNYLMRLHDSCLSNFELNE